MKLRNEILKEISKDSYSQAKLKLTNNKVTQYSSFYGLGQGYVPVGFEIPKDLEGNNRTLAMQLNLEELGSLDGLPEKGILQLWIDSDNEECVDWDGKEVSNLIYHENISKNIDLQSLPENDNEFIILPHDKKILKIEIEKPNSCVAQPYTIEANYDPETICEGDEDEEALYEYLSEIGEGHKLLGAPMFTQSDPRDERGSHDSIPTNYIQLLQIDYDYENDICIGDCGIYHIFIDPLEIKNKTFNKAKSYWDCC